MDYGDIITRSGRIIWKHKVLWVFGILSSCMGNNGGSGGGTNFSGEGLNWLFDLDTDTPAPPGIEQWFLDVGEMLESIPESAWINYLILILVVGLLLGVIFFALGVAGRIGLVRGVWLEEEGAAELRFEQLYDESAPYFWRVAGFYILLFLAGLLLIAGIVGMFATAAWAGLWALTPIICTLLCIFVPVSWVLAVLIEQAVVAMVGDDLSIMGAISRAWGLIWTNPGPMVIMGLVLILGPSIVSTIIGLPMLLVLAPLALGFMSSSEAGLGAGLAMSAVFLLVYIPVSIMLNGIMRAYVGTAWALTYRQLTAGAGDLESL